MLFYYSAAIVSGLPAAGDSQLLPNGDYAAKYTVSATESPSDASQTSRAVLEPHSCRDADHGQVLAAGRPANRDSIQEIWSLTESPITCPGSTLG